MQEILNNLNKEQIEAVLYNKGPLLLLAGAGTGKTRVLTSKISYVIKSNLAYPSQILAVTFTNKASNEMKERIYSMVNLDINSMWVGTFHSISVRILRQHGDLVGINNDFVIIDQGEQITIIKQIINELNLDIKEYVPKKYAELISKYKDKIKLNADSVDMFNEIFKKYQERLKKINACDFSDLIIYTMQLFKEKEDLKEYYNNKFKYIFVDEYQDTNFVQNEWLKLISGIDKNENINITCVGDDDQSIYGWRGAEIKNILKFKNTFKKAEIFKLERNYRSTQNILDIASCIISNNKNRHKKTLFSNNNNIGDKVNLIKCNDVKHEAMFIGEEINKIKNESLINNYKQVAILVRAGYQTRVFEDIFLKYNIPYVIIGGLKFYERKEVKDCIAYLRLVNNINDDLSFERIINVPKRGIGLTTIDKIRDFSVENNISMFEASLQLCNNNIIKGKTKEEIIHFTNNIKKWQNEDDISLKDLMHNILSEVNFIGCFLKDDDIESKNKIENIEEFENTLDDFENINVFLEYVSLVNDNNQKNLVDAVNILTIHSAKGLEFNTVFLPNWQEGIFPSPKSLDEISGIEEERRLAYVATTRAMNKLYISYSKYKYDYSELSLIEPSIFVKEIQDKELNYIDISSENIYYNNYYKYKKEYKNNYLNTNVDNENYKSSADIKRDEDNFVVKSYVNNKQDVKNIFKKCSHKTFGYGYIKKEDGNKLTIVFDRIGEKTILKDFINIID